MRGGGEWMFCSFSVSPEWLVGPPQSGCQLCLLVVGMKSIMPEEMRFSSLVRILLA